MSSKGETLNKSGINLVKNYCEQSTISYNKFLGIFQSSSNVYNIHDVCTIYGPHTHSAINIDQFRHNERIIIYSESLTIVM